MPLSPRLREVLAAAQAAGAIGPGAIEDHVAHALGFARSGWPPVGARGLDLGSGGGLPGLPLALAYPTTSWLLLDARRARADALLAAVHRLGLEERVEVRQARAEDAGRSSLRATFDMVVSRGFGSPATTAECAAPFLRVGGRLVVSDVVGTDRWPSEALCELGLRRVEAWRAATGAYAAMAQVQPCPARFPRRPPAMARRPLF